MIVPMRYVGQSGIAGTLDGMRVGFATNTLREATFLRADLGNPILFREALATLYQVVVSDYKYRPKDRVQFQAWLEEQDRKFLDSLHMKNVGAKEHLEELEGRLHELNTARDERRKDFYAARQQYVDYVYTSTFERFLIFDPVITIHPDEVAFEAFSRDESSYARLAAKYDLFARVDEFECGTTNIDFSTRLHQELQRLRSYRKTRFDVQPSGFQVTTIDPKNVAAHKEKKIELPDSWVNGFLQVHSTMALGLTHFRMAPVDMYNICRYLKRRKAKQSPRALRYELTPGQRVKVWLEPWEYGIELTSTAVYEGPKSVTVRTWGRDRLKLIERLLPVCQHVDVYLAGLGLPVIYVFDLGPLVFTLGLSGWTDNDWTGGNKFGLLVRQLSVDQGELQRVYEALRAARRASAHELAMSTGLGVEKCRSAVSYLCQLGWAMYDLAGQVYRHRDLWMAPFSAKEAAKAVKGPPQSSQEQNAQGLFDADRVRIIMRRPLPEGGYKLSGSCKGKSGPPVRPQLQVDQEGLLVNAECTCRYYQEHRLTQGPCEHILALRLAHMDRLEQEDRED